MTRGMQRAGPPNMQWVLDVRETVVIKPSSLNTVAQGLSSSLARSFPSHASLSSRLWQGCKQVGWGSPLQEYRGTAALHFTHTLSGQAGSDAQHCTVSLPWGRALGQPVRQASALVRASPQRKGIAVCSAIFTLIGTHVHSQCCRYYKVVTISLVSVVMRSCYICCRFGWKRQSITTSCVWQYLSCRKDSLPSDDEHRSTRDLYDCWSLFTDSVTGKQIRLSS